MSGGTNPSKQHGSGFGFGFKAIKRFPEIAPLAVIIGVAVIGAGSYVLYCLTKSDVMINRHQPLGPWDRINPEQKQKFMVVNQEYKKNPELEKLKKEMGDYK